MSKQFNVRISYNELLKRNDAKMASFSEPSLRKFILNNTVPFRKLPFVESLLEFSAVDIRNTNIKDSKKEFDVLANTLNTIFKMSIFKEGELKKTIIEINKIRLDSLEIEEFESLEPEKIVDLVDCLNYLFFYLESKLKEIVDIESIANELKYLKNDLTGVKFIGDLQFIQNLLEHHNVEEESFYEERGFNREEDFNPVYIRIMSEIVTSLPTLQFKLLIRFCFAYNSDSPFYNPFTDLPKSLATIDENTKAPKGTVKKDGENIEVESKIRATDKVFFHKQSLDRYAANPKDPFGQIIDAKLLNELSFADNKWEYCFNFKIKSKLTKLKNLMVVDQKNHEMKTDYSGNVIWAPPFEGFIKTPNTLTVPLDEIVPYRAVNVLLFLPHTFLDSKILKPLRDYLVKNFNVKLVVYVYSEKPPIDTYAVLISKKNSENEPFCPSYLKTSEWSTLGSAVDLVGFNNEKMDAKIKVIKETDETAKSNLGCWVVE